MCVFVCDSKEITYVHAYVLVYADVIAWFIPSEESLNRKKFYQRVKILGYLELMVHPQLG